MTAAAALDAIRGYAATGRYSYRRHARQRMWERNVSDADVRDALMNATTCVSAPHPAEERWRVEGPDTDGDALTAIVVVEDGAIVVTVF
jgi:hypothetical protein